MSQVSETAPAPSLSRRRFLPRFSLRTLLIAVLAVGSGVGLWAHWDVPSWVYVKKINGIFAGFGNGQTLLYHDRGENHELRTVAWSLEEQRIVETISGKQRPVPLGTERYEFRRNLLLPNLVSPDGKLFLLGGNRGFSLWNIDTGENVLSRPMETDGGRQLYEAQFLAGSPQKIAVFEYTATKDEDKLLTGTYRIYSGPEWTPGDPHPWSAQMSRAGYPLVSTTSNTFAVQPPEGGIRIVDLATNAERCRFPVNGQKLYSWCFSQDGTLLFAYTTSGKIWRCDTAA